MIELSLNWLITSCWAHVRLKLLMTAQNIICKSNILQKSTGKLCTQEIKLGVTVLLQIKFNMTFIASHVITKVIFPEYLFSTKQFQPFTRLMLSQLNTVNKMNKTWIAIQEKYCINKSSLVQDIFYSSWPGLIHTSVAHNNKVNDDWNSQCIWECGLPNNWELPHINGINW